MPFSAINTSMWKKSWERFSGWAAQDGLAQYLQVAAVTVSAVGITLTLANAKYRASLLEEYSSEPYREAMHNLFTFRHNIQVEAKTPKGPTETGQEIVRKFYDTQDAYQHFYGYPPEKEMQAQKVRQNTTETEAEKEKDILTPKEWAAVDGLVNESRQVELI